jgi:GT2 family glycosyltransferase
MHSGKGTAKHPPVSELTVIVVNYRTAGLTIACLETLARERASVPGLDVVVVDNKSDDGSVFAISAAIARRGLSGWTTLIEAPENLGFAGGNNLAVNLVMQRSLKPDFLLLLNSDTEVHPGCLRRCLDYARGYENLGVMSCLLLNGDGSTQNTARKFPRPDREVARAFGLPWILPRLLSAADLEDDGWNRRAETREVDWLGGAFLLMPTPVMAEVGGLDDDFFFYGEDIVFSHHVKRLGRAVVHWPGASITHFGGGSSDPDRLPSRWRTRCIWRGRLLVQRKCYGRAAEAIVHIAYLAAMLLRKAKIVCGGRRGELEDQKVSQGLSILRRPFEEVA